MAVNVKSMTRKELEKLKAQIEKQLERLATQDRKTALEAAEKAAKAHGFSLTELTGASVAKPVRKAIAAKAKGKVNPPKYRNPENPDQTWTGKGRRPEWIKAAQAAGVDIDKSMAI